MRKEIGLRINSSTVGMESAGSYKTTSVTVRRFVLTDYQTDLTNGNNALYASIGSEAGNAENAENMQKNEDDGNVGKTGESKGTRLFTLEDWQSRMQVTSTKITHRSTVTQTAEDIRQTTLRYIFDLLFSGYRNRLHRWRDALEDTGITRSNSVDGQQNAQPITDELQTLQPVDGFSVKTLSLAEETIYMENQSASFSTMGTVHTADGREINFNVNVGMSRSFQQTFSQELNLASFQMCDPLVINLDTDVAELSDQTFYFDIDGDGEEDEVSRLDAGSGYLTLDKNGDGVVNDGSELFGTASGDGFADLAKYDEDGNGWIDEADAIWDKLQIWCKDDNGQDKLYRLSDKGVGAICLQNSATDFSLTGQTGQMKGAIRSTGVFLYENGNVGTVQHVDVAKYEKQA